jgi:hypothetical protein
MFNTNTPPTTRNRLYESCLDLRSAAFMPLQRGLAIDAWAEARALKTNPGATALRLSLRAKLIK